MKKTQNSHKNPTERPRHNIPDIQIIDLEIENDKAPNAETVAENNDDIMEQEPKKQNSRFSIHTAMHLALLAVAVMVVIVIAYRVTHWGNFISQEEIFSDGEGTYDNSMDLILPVLDDDGNIILTEIGEDMTILMFGNSPLTDDRDSEDGLANMIAAYTGANVINCAVSDSYMGAVQYPYRADQDPMDIYTPYWLVALNLYINVMKSFEESKIEMGESLPAEAEEVVETMSTLDLNTVDVIVFMYDGADYLLGHKAYNADNTIDLLTFNGNMEATIELIQNYYPHIRIIVMSPTYVFGVDENGNYISSDDQTYNDQDFLYDYTIYQYESCLRKGVTYVDNLYGTITEENASEYLTDNIHLNAEGRRLMADRLIYALIFYSR